MTEPTKAIDHMPHEADINALLDFYENLTKQAQKLAFPSLRKGASAPPDMSGWSRLRRVAFAISTPLPTTLRVADPTIAQISRIAIFLVWFALLCLWTIMLHFYVQDLLGNMPASTLQAEETALYQLLVYALLLATVFSTFPAYWRWIEFYRDRRYSVIWKVILSFGFVALLITFSLIIVRELYVNDSLSRLLTIGGLIGFFRIHILLVIPMLTLLYWLLVDMAIWVTWLLQVALEYWISAHNPFPKKTIRELALKPIGAGRPQAQKWQLVQLDEAKLEMLKAWATANREGTDKRLLPTALFFAVLGLFANTEAFSRAVDRILSWFLGNLGNLLHTEGALLTTAFNLALTVTLLLLLGTVFGYVMLSLFRNLVVQSLIVEACIVAQHARAWGAEARLENVDSEKERKLVE